VERVVVAVALAAAILVVAALLRGRRRAPPTQVGWEAPTQLDRRDFEEPDAPWLVAVFTSATCASCEEALAKAAPLAGREVAVQEVEAKTRSDLHRRYRIDAVPMIVIADGEGVVRASFVGPPSAADLWAAVAEAREPGAS
jgi:hypothetical protein